MLKKIAFIFCALVIGTSSGMLFARHADAAGLSFSAPSTTIHQGQTLAVDIMLDPKGQSINTVAATVTIPSNVDFVSSDDSSSVIGQWIDRPAFSSLTRSLTFSGIVPGGFSGLIDPFNPSVYKPGVLLRIYVRGRMPGTGSLIFSDSQAYVNDDQGTAAAVSTSPLAITVDELLGTGGTTDASKDTEPPLAFSPILTRDPDLYGGKYVLIFNTKDTGSGIDHYEVKEGTGAWTVAESPYVLIDQSISGDIIVKAVDHAGNAEYETVSGLRSSELWQSLSLGILLALILFFFLFAAKKRKKKHDVLRPQN